MTKSLRKMTVAPGPPFLVITDISPSIGGGVSLHISCGPWGYLAICDGSWADFLWRVGHYGSYCEKMREELNDD